MGVRELRLYLPITQFLPIIECEILASGPISVPSPTTLSSPIALDLKIDYHYIKIYIEFIISLNNHFFNSG